jgi:predicted PurR-regulated permease PerM
VQSYAKRVWIAVGIGSAVLLMAWLISELFLGLLIIFAGVMLGVVLAQLSKLLSRLSGISYQVAYAVVVLLLAAVLLGGIGLMGAQIALQASEFVRQIRESGEQLEKRLAEQPWWSEAQALQADAMDLLASRQAVSTATSAVSSTFSALAGGVLVAFLGVYFAVWPERYRNGFLSLVPPARRRRVGNVIDMNVTALWRWFLGRLAGMLVIGIGSSIGLWLLGVPLPISLGVLAGLLTFVPNVGPLIALVPAVLFALQVGTDTALYVILFYFALQTVESYLLTPMIDQYQVAVPPGLTLSAQLLFGLVGGVLGLLLATPLVVVISILLREFYVRDILEAEPVRSG